jgi:hypothetical protein
MNSFKREGEKIPLAMNFAKLLAQLPGTQTILDGDVKVLNSKKEDVTATMLVEKTIGSTRIDSIIQGGTKGKQCVVIFSIETQDFELEESIILDVK